MATFTVTSSVINFDDNAFSTRTGNDAYNLSLGGKLVIDTDTRYCRNSSPVSGTIAQIGLNTATVVSGGYSGQVYIDGSKVRLIPFNVGAGTVPVAGTVISAGGVSSELLGVWTSFALPPITAGATMSGSGYIKVKNVTGGTYAAGVLSGITASATGPDTVGWIEVVGVESSTIICYRKNKFTISGSWFEHSTLVTTGLSGSTYQLPASLANTYYAGVWVETAVSSSSYEFFAAAGTLVSASSIASDTIRGEVCWISSQGLVRFGYDGTNTNGYLPTAGRRIRVPNVTTLNATVAAPTINQVPNATLTTRYEFLTTNCGDIDINTANMSWYCTFNQPFSVNMSNTCVLDTLAILTPQTPINLTDVHVGQSGAVATTSLTLSNVFGGDITDCTWSKAVPTVSVAGATIIGCRNITFTRGKSYHLAARTLITHFGWSMSSCTDLIWQDHITGTGVIAISYCKGITWNNTVWYDTISGPTTAANAQTVFSLGSRTEDVIVDNFNFGGLPQAMSAGNIATLGLGDLGNYTFRNFGSPTGSLDLGGPEFIDTNWSRVTTTCTVTASNHNLTTNDTIYVSMCDSIAAVIVGIKTPITRLTANTFSFVCLNAGNAAGVLSYYQCIAGNGWGLSAGNSVNHDITIQNCYLTHARTSCFPITAQVIYNITQSNVWGDDWNPALMVQRNSVNRGVRGGHTLVPQVASYGTHWVDLFLSPLCTATSSVSWTRNGAVAAITSSNHGLITNRPINILSSSSEAAIPWGGRAGFVFMGAINSNVFTIACNAAGATSGILNFENLDGLLVMQMNEPSTETIGLITSTSMDSPAWNGAGTMVLPNPGDSITWEMPDYCIGHTRFPNTIPSFGPAQASWNQVDCFYQIDKNDGAGFSGWKNIYYNRPGGACTIGTFGVTMSNTSGVLVGDYVHRHNTATNIGVNAKVVSIDTATTITVDVAAIATTSGVDLAFRSYPNEANIDAQKGFKLKFKMTAVLQNILSWSFMGLRTTSTNTSRAYQYPLSGSVPASTLWAPNIGDSVYLTLSSASLKQRASVVEVKFPVQDPITGSLSRYEYKVIYDSTPTNPNDGSWGEVWTTVAGYVPVFSALPLVSGSLAVSGSLTQYQL